MSRVRAACALVAAGLLAGPASARIVLLQTDRGPVWTSVPEPAGNKLPKPTSRRLPYLQLIADTAARHGVDARLVEAIVACESDFETTAVSSAGARGLMQLMPETAAQYGVADSFDPAQNVDGGTRHLRDLLERFGHDWKLTIAAYNAGAGAVTRAGGVPPYPETMHYVRKVQHYLGYVGAAVDGVAQVAWAAPVAPEGVSFAGEAVADPVLDWKPEPEPVAEPEPPRRRAPPAVMTRDARGRVLFTDGPRRPAAKAPVSTETKP